MKLDINHIKDKIFNNEEYNFLWNNDKLNDNIILLTLGGSHAYGTSLDSKISDIDARGIALNTPK